MSVRTPEPTTDSGPIETLAPKMGDRVGSYRLLRLIGEGASGRVFEVEHLTIGRRAAMKILAPEAAARPGALRRLFAEAQAVNKISNSHIVEVTDVVEDDESGLAAIVMELLEGKSLAQAMAEQRLMPSGRFIPIMAQVADALAAAHEARFVHRDLKPENVFLTTQNGQPDFVKLLDFGLAKTMRETLTSIDTAAVKTAVPPPQAPPPAASRGPRGPRRSHLTAEGTFVGTPAYASPEQAAGKQVDHRTDIYSFGVILYELLCGHLPFEGRNFAEYLVKHLTQPPPAAPPEVLRTPTGRTLDGVARRCLAKDPAGRFQSATEVKNIFDRLASGQTSVPGFAPGLGARLAEASPRRWVLALLGVGAIAGTAAMVRGRRKSQLPASPPPARRPTVAPGPIVEPLVPKATERVFLRFESTPSGAETRRVGDGELLGLTPFQHTLPATGESTEYEMKLRGYAPRRYRVVLSADKPVQTVGGRLRRETAPKRASRPQKAAPKKKTSRNATLNPFSR